MNPRILLIKILLISSFCQSFNTLKLSFIQTVDNNKKKDVTKGTIYYDHKKATLKIIEPLLQWMILSNNQTLIYYPEEKRGIYIKSKSPAKLPFFQSFIAIIKSDFGLSEIGYKLDLNEIKGDTLFTYWTPAEDTKGIKSKEILIFLNDKIIGMKSYNNGEILIKSQFQDHFKYGGFYFPLKVNIIYYYQGHKTVIENINYSEPVFDHPLPQEVINFKVPEDIKMKEIEW